MARPTRPRNVPIVCRLAWRPSRWVWLALVAMGVGSVVVIAASDLSPALQRPLGACALLWSLASLLRERRRPSRVLETRSDGVATLDDAPLARVEVHWRGVLAFVRARDPAGRLYHLAFWPDTLDARERRLLRLACAAAEPLAAQPRGMRG